MISNQGMIGKIVIKIAYNHFTIFENRCLESKQCTSIITNFDYDTIRNIEIVTIEDDIDEVSENSKTEEQKQSNILDYITDSDTKKMIESKQPSDKSFNKRRVRKPKKKLFQVIDTSSDASSSSSKQLMTVSFDEDNEMLFTGLIDVRNDKPSFDKLTSMLNDTDRYKTVYWDPYRTELEQATQDERLDHRDFEDKQRLIDTLDQIDRILDQNKTRSKQIHRPRSIASRIFVDNIEMISN